MHQALANGKFLARQHSQIEQRVLPRYQSNQNCSTVKRTKYVPSSSADLYTTIAEPVQRVGLDPVHVALVVGNEHRAVSVAMATMQSRRPNKPRGGRRQVTYSQRLYARTRTANRCTTLLLCSAGRTTYPLMGVMVSESNLVCFIVVEM